MDTLMLCYLRPESFPEQGVHEETALTSPLFLFGMWHIFMLFSCYFQLLECIKSNMVHMEGQRHGDPGDLQ